MADPIPSLWQKIKWRFEVLAYDVVRGVMALFPFHRVSQFGGWLFRKIGPRTSKHHIVLTGLRTAFPEKTDAQIANLARAQWDNAGRTFAEFPLLGRVKVFDKNSNVEVEGLQRMQALAEANQGAILISGHFANWEIMAAVFAQANLPVRVTYRPTNNPYFDKRIRAQRAKYGIQLMVPKSRGRSARQLITALRAGDSIAILNDQKFNEGIAVPFFGVNAMTAPGAVRLALKTGAPLIPMSCERIDGGAQFKVAFLPPISLTVTGDQDQDIRAGVIQITQFVEDQIRANPEQWFWVHRRWDKAHYREPSDKKTS